MIGLCDPSDGRFLTQDSYRGEQTDAGTWNLYQYCAGNPINYTDPTGHAAVKLTKKEEAVGKIIKKNKANIKKVSQTYIVDPVVVGGVIFAEQSLNVDWKDSASDWIGFWGILDTSVGLGQVKMSTAKFLELDKRVKMAASRGARYKRLVNNGTNIVYVAAYIRYFVEKWRAKVPNIKQRPEILGTLYNLGHEKTKPNAKPVANPFGKYVKKHYNYVKKCLR